MILVWDEQQDHIDPSCMEMASAAMIHFGLDPGKFVHFLLGKYTGQYWDVPCTLDAVWDHGTSDDYNHIKWILLDGCPTQLTYEKCLSNNSEFISCSNSKSLLRIRSWFEKQWTKKTAIAIRFWWIRSFANISLPTSYYSKYCHKDSKNDHIVWDGSTVTRPINIVMNQVTPVIAQELPVTFGHFKSQIYMDIYNTSISYQTATILLGLANVKVCFWYPRIHAELAGAFGFIADELYNFAMAIVFDSTASASSWEAFSKPSKLSQKVLLTGLIWLNGTRNSLICWSGKRLILPPNSLPHSLVPSIVVL